MLLTIGLDSFESRFDNSATYSSVLCVYSDKEPTTIRNRGDVDICLIPGWKILAEEIQPIPDSALESPWMREFSGL